MDIGSNTGCCCCHDHGGGGSIGARVARQSGHVPVMTLTEQGQVIIARIIGTLILVALALFAVMIVIQVLYQSGLLIFVGVPLLGLVIWGVRRWADWYDRRHGRGRYSR